MRILFACEFYHPSVGGVQEVIRQVAERLVERGHQASVATSYLPDRQARVLNGVTIREFRISGNLARGMSGALDAYREFLMAEDYDVLVVKAAQQWSLDAAIAVLDRITKPKVFIPCGFSGLYDPVYADYYRRMSGLLRKFDHLLFYASDYRDIELARRHGLSNFTILPNGASEREFLLPVDSGFRRRHGIPEDAFVVLTVGSLTGRKGHLEVAQAFALCDFGNRPAVLVLNGNSLPPPPRARTLARIRDTVNAVYKGHGIAGTARWAIGRVIRPHVGEQGGEAAVRALASRINAEQRSRGKRAMVVALPRPELVQAYLNSDLFAFGSHVEYSPLVLFEAAAAGLPFLSAPVGNAEEIALWTGGGEICPAPRDPQGYTRVDPRVFAQRLMALAANRDALGAYGEAGRRNWLERFTWERITDRYEEILVRLASGRRDDVHARSRPSAVQPVQAPRAN